MLGSPGRGGACRPVPTVSPQRPPDPLKSQRCPSPSKHTLSFLVCLLRPGFPPCRTGSFPGRGEQCRLRSATRTVSLERGGRGPQPEPTLPLRG